MLFFSFFSSIYVNGLGIIIGVKLLNSAGHVYLPGAVKVAPLYYTLLYG